VANRPCPADLKPMFRREVFKLLKAHGRPDDTIELYQKSHVFVYFRII
jgi:hypothetical protein